MRVTVPPFEPEVPHACSSALKKYPEPLFVIVTLVRLIVLVVLVTQKISPIVFVIEPFVIVKADVPLEASFDIDLYNKTAWRVESWPFLVAWLALILHDVKVTELPPSMTTP